jgi:hypothetical protein
MKEGKTEAMTKSQMKMESIGRRDQTNNKEKKTKNGEIPQT